MDSISITQLKTNPAKAISDALDYPVAIENRNEVKAYLIGKDIYDRLISFIEDFIDRSEVATADFSKKKNFEDVAKELGI